MIVDNPQLSVSVLTFHCSLQGHCGVNASAYHDLLNTQLPSHSLVDDGASDNKIWRNQVEAVRVLSEDRHLYGHANRSPLRHLIQLICFQHRGDRANGSLPLNAM